MVTVHIGTWHTLYLKIFFCRTPAVVMGIILTLVDSLLSKKHCHKGFSYKRMITNNNKTQPILSCLEIYLAKNINP